MYHQHARFKLGFQRSRVDSHLVTESALYAADTSGVQLCRQCGSSVYPDSLLRFSSTGSDCGRSSRISPDDIHALAIFFAFIVWQNAIRRRYGLSNFSAGGGYRCAGAVWTT